MITRCKLGLGDVGVVNTLEGLLVFLCLVLELALMISVALDQCLSPSPMLTVT